MNHLYLQLGRAIAAQCPPGFKEARLEAAPDDGKLVITCAFADGGEVKPTLDELARRAVLAALGEVRAAMAAQDGKAWRACTVTLIAGGGFQMDVAD